MPIEHRRAPDGSRDANDRWDGLEREGAVDRGVLSNFSHFCASLLGADNPSGRSTWSGVPTWWWTENEAQAERAQHAARPAGGGPERAAAPASSMRCATSSAWGGRAGVAAMVERSREAYGTSGNQRSMANERAMASNRISPTGGADLREPEVEHPPGLRYADQDKPV